MTKQNVILSLMAFSFFVVFLMPYILWHLDMFDRHYFGLFNEKLPILATTTIYEEWYLGKGMEIRTPEQITLEHKMRAYHQRNGNSMSYLYENKTNVLTESYQGYLDVMPRMARRALMGVGDSSLNEEDVLLGDTDGDGELSVEEQINLDLIAANLTDKYKASYPEPFLTTEQIQYGGFLVYLGSK